MMDQVLNIRMNKIDRDLNVLIDEYDFGKELNAELKEICDRFKEFRNDILTKV